MEAIQGIFDICTGIWHICCARWKKRHHMYACGCEGRKTSWLWAQIITYACYERGNHYKAESNTFDLGALLQQYEECGKKVLSFGQLQAGGLTTQDNKYYFLAELTSLSRSK